MNLIKLIAISLFSIYVWEYFNVDEVNWIAIGDSITYLNDHPDETGNRVSKGYLTFVTDRFSNLKSINKGYNGSTSEWIAQHIDSIGLSKANVYSVFLGTNDWWQGRPVGTLADYKENKGNNSYYGSFRIIINKIRSLNPAAKIILITPMQRADFVYIKDANNNAFGSYKVKNGQSLEKFALAIDSIGRYEHISVIELYHNVALPLKDMTNFKRLKNPLSGLYVNYEYPKSAVIPFEPKTDDYPYPVAAMNLTYDGLHPSDKGNAIIGQLLIDELKNIMPQLKHQNYIELKHVDRWKKYIDLNKYTSPFWKADTIVDESIQVLKTRGTATSSLLFKAKKILSVKSTDFMRVYKQGVDWEYIDGKLKFGSSSSVPFLENKDLLSKEEIPNHTIKGKVPGTFIPYSEGMYFSSKQLLITYVKDKRARWHGPISKFASQTLPHTITKLLERQSLKVVFYGNSIEVGYNASGFENAIPFMPVWPELFVEALRNRYHGPVLFANTSVAGKLAKWGLDSVNTNVVAEKPDLVVIGFGMNDGTQKVTLEIYRQQITGIIDAVRKKNSTTEFILISPMLANPASSFSGFQSLYAAELRKITGKGIALADLTKVHQELLKYKTYQDMTGNNINHPNDYLARWYAQVVAGLLIK